MSNYRWANASYAVGPASPALRVDDQMAWDASDGYLLLFGGVTDSGTLVTDTWTYANGTWTNITSTLLGPSPPSLTRAAMGYDPSSQSVILFGGYHNGAYRNYTWSYHDRVWKNLTSTAGGPAPYYTPSIATDASDDQIVTAFVDAHDIAETWSFHGGTWHNLTSTVALPVQAQLGPFLPIELCADPADSGVLLLSEMVNGSGYYGTTYIFESGSWRNLTSQNPVSPMYAYGINPFNSVPLFYLPSAAAVVFFTTLGQTRTGAYDGNPETWAFASDRWTNITSTAGSAPAVWIVLGGAVAVDPADSAAILFGGESGGSGAFKFPTWTFSAPPVVHETSTPLVLDQGSSVSDRGSSTFGLEPNTAAWSFGDGATGAGSSATHTYANPGVYTVNLTVTDLLGQSGVGSASVVVNPIPTVTIAVGPSSPAAGSDASLLATVDGGSPPFSYNWSLGDGGEAANVGPVVTHVYGSAGSYTVKVKITDAEGASANATLKITVASPNNSLNLTSGLGLGLLGLIAGLLVLAVVLGWLAIRSGRKQRPPPQ